MFHLAQAFIFQQVAERSVEAESELYLGYLFK